WCGTDSFTYVANDGSLDSNVATVTITALAAPVDPQPPVPPTPPPKDPTLVPKTTTTSTPAVVQAAVPQSAATTPVSNPPPTPPTGNVQRSSYTHGGGDQAPPEPAPVAALPVPTSDLALAEQPSRTELGVLPGQMLPRRPKEAMLTGTGDE